MEPINNSQQVTPPLVAPVINPTPPPPSFQRKKGKLWILIALVIILFLLSVSAVAGFVIYKNLNKQPEQVACTLEAMICPDGSSVGRSGPKCEFTPCPTPSAVEANKLIDSETKNKAVVFQNALIRYYVVHSAYPWNDQTSNNNLCKSVLQSDKLAAISLDTPEMSACIYGTNFSLSSEGDIPNNFDKHPEYLIEYLSDFNRNPEYLSNIFVTWNKDNENEIIVCSSPTSREQKASQETIYSRDGSVNLENCPNANATDGNCYWCLR